MEPFKIQGKIVYKKLGPGFWGIVDDEGRKWRPVCMPDNMKQEGLDVTVKARLVKEGASIFMWGRPVEILNP